jgi:hypothetical protein
VTAISAAAITATHNCKTPRCEGEARSTRGVAAYCKDCQEKRKASNSSGGGLVDRLQALTALGRTADRLRVKAEKQTRLALDAKQEADEAAAAFRQAARELMGDDVDEESRRAA